MSQPNDLMKAEQVILPVLKQDSPETKKKVKEIGSLMKNAFALSGLSPLKRNVLWWYLNNSMKKDARKGHKLNDMEARLRPMFKKRLDHDTVYVPAATKRAKRLAEGMKGDIIGESIADLGAGNGLIAEYMSSEFNKKVHPIDVVDYSLGTIPIILFDEGNTVPLESKSVDTTIIYLVLHHSDDPIKLLQEAVRITKSRIIIMEGLIDDPGVLESNSILDWFLNRVVQGVDMNLPLNYKTTQNWRKVFDEMNLEVVKEVKVGIDEPLAPEEHVYFVLNVK